MSHRSRSHNVTRVASLYTFTSTSTVAFEDSIRQHLLGSLNTGAHPWHGRREEIFIDHWG
jgi:hypothetical protein